MPAPAITTNAPNLPAQLFECAVALSNVELALPEEERPDNVQVALDIEGGTVSVTATFPATFVVAGDGGINIDVQDYIP